MNVDHPLFNTLSFNSHCKRRHILKQSRLSFRLARRRERFAKQAAAFVPSIHWLQTPPVTKASQTGCRILVRYTIPQVYHLALALTNRKAAYRSRSLPESKLSNHPQCEVTALNKRVCRRASGASGMECKASTKPESLGQIR